jgi:translation initiation factor 2B subunit (eIF-2B alpha/beta/delta family)
MKTTPRLIQVLEAHAHRYGADDAALALMESIKQTYIRNKPRIHGYDGLSLRDSFERIVDILSTGQVAQAAAHNAVNKVYATVFGSQEAVEVVEQAQWSRLIEVLETEIVEEGERQRVLSESLATQIGSAEVIMLFGINAVIYRLLRHLANRVNRKIELEVVRTPMSLQIVAGLKQVLPRNVAITPISFSDVAENLETKIERVLLAPSGLTKDLQLVGARGGELLVSLAEQAQIPVMVPLAPLDLYQYPANLTKAHQAIGPSPVIQYVLATGIYAANDVVAALG